MTNEERNGLVLRLKDFDHNVDIQTFYEDDFECVSEAADQIEADGQRIAELEREKAVVSDLLEQQKELALEYLFDCNRAGERIAELEARVAYLDGGARVGRFRITLPYGGAPDKIAIYDGPEGGDFDRDELEALIARFYEDRF